MSNAGAESRSLTIESALANPQIIAEASLLVLWRTAFDDGVATLLKIARTSGAVVLFDADDLVIEPQLARIKVIDGIRTQNLSEWEVEVYYRRTLRSFEAADYACCSTEELASAMRIRGKPTFVLPNGYTDAGHRRARYEARNRRATASDGLIRIGYATGTRTHQRDFAQVAEAIACVLRQHTGCRLVLFKCYNGKPLLDPFEFDCLKGLEKQIEWREFVTQDDLPAELARFDINIAPLEIGNPFCEAKSELKFVEAALVEVCTVASPTGPFRRAMRHEETGLLADGSEQWESALLRLLNDPSLRRRLARAAYRDVLWKYGAHRRTERAAAILEQILGNARAAASAAVVQRHCQPDSTTPELPLAAMRTVFESDQLREAEVTVVIPLYNYDRYIREALDSVAAQTLQSLDLVVVNDASTDNSPTIAETWIRAHSSRFNRVVLLSNTANSGLSRTRNAAIDAAETTFVLPLDPDDRLRPKACETLLAAIRNDQAAFVYPLLQQFGGGNAIMGKERYLPELLVGGNTIDATTLIRKDCWAAVGGYAHIPQGWEDFDFWCCLAEKGMWGRQCPEILVEYRMHGASMQDLITDLPHNKRPLLELMKRRHPWLSLVQSFNAIQRSRTTEVSTQGYAVANVGRDFQS